MATLFNTSRVVHDRTLFTEQVLTERTLAGSVWPSNVTLACLISPDDKKKEEEGGRGRGDARGGGRERERGDAG